VKDEHEIQRAHDMLVGIILGEAPVKFSPATIEVLVGCTDVLCWVLDHDHNQSFKAALLKLEAEITRHGSALIDYGN
jgi:hypothetical protein